MNKEYTKQELTCFKNSVAALAAAVIQQWKEDGCPACDLKVIEAWQAVLEEAQKTEE